MNTNSKLNLLFAHPKKTDPRAKAAKKTLNHIPKEEHNGQP